MMGTGEDHGDGGGMGKRRKTYEYIKYGAVGGVKRKESTCARVEGEYWGGY